jgi:hypothetical protein
VRLATTSERHGTSQLTYLWWVGLPRHAVRLSRTVSATVADGHFLAAYPVLGAVATPASLITGLTFGSWRVGYYRSFSESLALVLVAVACGYLAGQLGAAFVTGFAAGDFLIGQTKWIFHSDESGILGDGLVAALVRVRLPMLIAYLLLLSLTVALPALIRRMLQNLPGVSRLPGNVGFGIAALLTLVVVYLGVQVWVPAAAVLIRPLYTWSVRLTLFGVQIPPDRVVAAEAVQTFQQDGVWIVRTAVAATLVRLVMVWLSLVLPVLRRRRGEVEAALVVPIADRPATERVGPLPMAVLAAGTSTLMLAGMIEVWWLGVLFFTEFLVLRALSLGLLPPRINGWRRLVARMPLILRLAVALLVVQSLASVLISRSLSFTPMALFVASAVAMLYVLVPGEPLEERA